jgi:hypothetical protein
MSTCGPPITSTQLVPRGRATFWETSTSTVGRIRPPAIMASAWRTGRASVLRMGPGKPVIISTTGKRLCA